MCNELGLDVNFLLETVGLLEEEQEKKYEVKIKNVNEDYFEIMAKNPREAAIIVTKFVIENGIIELDSSQEIVVDVVEIFDEEEENSDEIEEEIDEESSSECPCESCIYYCPYCGECTYGE
ncbi:hypothetical protein [Clostridium sp. C1]|nr:hypothetical protein [Clostridium sp. C1]